MRIDRKLHLVIPVQRERGTIYVHSAPISREVYELHFKIMAKAFAEIFSRGLGIIAGPNVGYLTLRDVAREQGRWDGPDGVQNSLIAEIRRLANVALPTDAGGWTTLPLQSAIERDVFTADELFEIEGEICFFILTSATMQRSKLEPLLAGLGGLWETQITYSNATEFIASLTTSTAPVSSGEKMPAVSLPPS